MNHLRPTRRQLLQGTGGLVITFALGGMLRRNGEAQQRAVPADPYIVKLPDDQTNESILTQDDIGRVDSWLSISQTGDVAIFVGKVELGTGIMTAFAQIAAEELDVPFARVTVIQGDTDLTPDQGYTAGSMSIQVARPILQQAAAEARSILIDRAATLLNVPDTDLQVHDGVIVSQTDATNPFPMERWSTGLSCAGWMAKRP